MRSLHGLLLLVVLVLALVGGLLWLGTGSNKPGPADPSASQALPARATGAETELSAPESEAQQALRNAGAAGSAAPRALAAGTEIKSSTALSGRVLGPDGRGVAKARVFGAPAEGSEFLPLDAVDPKRMPWIRRADAETDAEGRFQVDVGAQTHVRLAVRAAGFAPLDAERTLARGERELGDVQLEQGVVLEGRVRDPQGRPVAQAEIVSQPRQNGFAFAGFGRARAPLARTDAQGRFTIDMLASGPWRLLVSSEDHPDKTFEGLTDRPGARASNLDFVLEEGAEIQGRVTGARPADVASLQVSAQARGENDEGQGGLVFGPDGFQMPRRAKVSADGGFRLRGLKPNQNYRLSAQREESSFFAFGGGRGGVSAKSGDRGVEVPVVPEPAIVCQVVDAGSGAPVTEMDVKAGYRWMMPLMSADNVPQRSFPEGKVRFERLPPRMGFGGGGDKLKLRIDATGYKSYESPELEPAGAQDIDLGLVRLERAPVCRVEVVDLATRGPLAGAEVTLRLADGADEGRMVFRTARGGVTRSNDENSSHGTTGADGQVVLSSFPGKRATLQVRHADRAPYQSEPFVLEENADHEETVRLGRGGDVLVRVSDAQGRPVASVEIEHEAGQGEAAGPWTGRMNMEGPSRTDARGELPFAHLRPGTHKFRLAQEGGGLRFLGGGGMRAAIAIGGIQGQEVAEEPWISVEVAEGASSEVKLVAPARGTLVGRVREGGQALAGAALELNEKQEGGAVFGGMNPFGGGSAHKTSGSGEYRIEGVKPGKYVLSLTHPSRSMPWEAELEVREGEQRFDVDLPIAIVEGRVTGPDGKPIAGARVRAERFQGDAPQEERVMSVVMTVAGDDGGAFAFGNGASETERTDADGRYTLRGVLTDTELKVHVNGKDLQPGSSEKFRVAPDQTLRGIDLVLKQGGALEVTVMRAGQPVRNAFVNAVRKSESGGSTQSETTGPGGVARFTGLEPGEWEVSVEDFSNMSPENSQPPTPEKRSAAVEAGKTQKLRVDLP